MHLAREGARARLGICFVVDDDDRGRPVIYTPLDEKPKEATDPRRLARARDIGRDPAVALLVDRWSEDWSKLGWLRLAGLAALLEPEDAPDEHAAGLAALLEKYQQYATHRLEERPLIRIEVVSSRSWGDLSVSA